LNPNNLPSHLKTLIDNEQVDFAFKTKRNSPRKTGLSVLFFSLFWNALVSIFVVAFLVPLFSGEEVHFKVNDVPTSGSLENIGEALVPTMMIILFLIVGIGMFIWSLILLLQKGGYFVGTPTRMIKYRNGKMEATDWEQFTGNVKISGKENNGDLEFELRTGKIKKKNKSNEFVPDVIYISGIDQVYAIEKKCRVRIKENDPTPAIELEDENFDSRLN